MKTSLFILLSLVMGQAMAFEKYVCVSYDYATETMTGNTVVLEKTGKPYDFEEDGEWIGTKIPYQLTYFKGLHWDDEFSVKGEVLTEDVYFNFTSKDGKTEFTIYLDEMEESSLKIQGQSGSEYFKCF